ncbi:hypothetical protein EHS86_08780 [Erwinia amylovora]|uniref:Uncharacterized protein n=2 Tax=Erwinia amylovora TaxID=552 RepID=A0A830ZVB8_ERWAM|nr:hypothetical protein AD997_03775 [Erwinia amylovora]EKV52872.1 hypothetical protein EaACW_2884 [Erwinia amylovora ACW56400]CBA22546.1 hypothetical protein predicted by Glimmer/Critica [Erwinia amylovora CFBP1430]CCO79726.1 hypothetical protein BN432_2947 [Erwinia amylovora Ea356]CCO83529.1 hypothetical protein BN433_2972 [Erwinia amylovora Ea266]CCO87288.1 hypothetical protein BN434_2918 [Erwinia amylovora CFBP 2585]CCO91085.1 hypothetical protein BN435_2933 [Erwinia amylovora 01SFR-BO]CC
MRTDPGNDSSDFLLRLSRRRFRDRSPPVVFLLCKEVNDAYQLNFFTLRNFPGFQHSLSDILQCALVDFPICRPMPAFSCLRIRAGHARVTGLPPRRTTL